VNDGLLRRAELFGLLLALVDLKGLAEVVCLVVVLCQSLALTHVDKPFGKEGLTKAKKEAKPLVTSYRE
jgi:hypothetical protein